MESRVLVRLMQKGFTMAKDPGASDRGATDRGASDRGASDRGVNDRGARDLRQSQKPELVYSQVGLKIPDSFGALP